MIRLASKSSWLAAALALGLVTTGVSEASAQSTLCRDLGAELASTRVDTSLADRAVERQQRQLQRAQDRLQRNGCDGSEHGSMADRCDAIVDRIDRMERNLDTLEDERDAARDNSQTRDAILDALEANDCSEADRQSGQSAALELRDVLGGDEPDDMASGAIDDTGDEDESGDPPRIRRTLRLQDGELRDEAGLPLFSGPAGSFQTLCVRSCDGYFFPMASNASSADFGTHRSACETSCPGADMDVYYRRIGDEDPSRMMSAASGRPYSELPTAFLYKRPDAPRPLNCGCARQAGADGYSIIAGSPPALLEPELRAEPDLPKPAARPDPAADPETQADARGGLDAEAIRRLSKPSDQPTADIDQVDRKVRVVGPTFLPAPEAAIDLRAPAQTPIQ